jgi:hypothetical protein
MPRPESFRPPLVNAGAGRWDSRGLSILLAFARLVMLGAAMWWVKDYHDGISYVVGEYLPWPRVKGLGFQVAMAEAFLIEALVCLPLVYFIQPLFGRWTMAAALLISVPCVWRAALEALFTSIAPLAPALILFHGFSHFAFLVGGTAIAKSRAGLQRGNAP